MFEKLKEPKYIGLVVAILLGVFSLWFYKIALEQKNYFVIDNPTAEDIQAILDGETYFLPPYKTLQISLGKGEHFLQLPTDSTSLPYTFTIQDEVRGLINPTQSPYIIYTRYYAKNLNKDSLLTAHKTLIDSVTYYGELKLDRAPYIKEFYLNVNQDYPLVIKDMDTISGIKKIFRYENFKAFYNDNFH